MKKPGLSTPAMVIGRTRGVYLARLWLGAQPALSQNHGGNMPAEIGDVAPDFTLPSVSEGDITLSSYRGQKHVVLSFHVFDFTAG